MSKVSYQLGAQKDKIGLQMESCVDEIGNQGVEFNVSSAEIENTKAYIAGSIP